MKGQKVKRSVPVVLTIAGSDNSGGAGIQADLKTFCHFGVYGTSALTCVVAEHPSAVRAIQSVKPSVVGEQIAMVMEAFPVAAIKTGMLYSAPIIAAVVACLQKQRPRSPLVVDPVMVATSGARLLKTDAVRTLCEELLPMADLMTPNLDEAALLVGEPIPTVPAMREAADLLRQTYGCAVLLKGGHLGGDTATDVLATEDDVRVYQTPYIHGVNTHGTGCTLSAAVAALLAQGHTMPQAVEGAKKFISKAISQAVRVGRYDLLNHLQ